MISDDNLRARLEAAGIASETRSNPAPATRGISSKQARRGTPEFDNLMEELEDEWELDEEELDNIFEIRLKGEVRWELLEDDDEGDDSPRTSEDQIGEDEDFGEEE